MKELPSIKPMHAHHFNLLASCPDSSNMRISPLQTGPFALHMMEWILSAKKLTQTNVPHPSTGYTFPGGHLISHMELSNFISAWNCQTSHQPKNNFIICALHLDASCLAGFK